MFYLPADALITLLSSCELVNTEKKTVADKTDLSASPSSVAVVVSLLFLVQALLLRVNCYREES